MSRFTWRAAASALACAGFAAVVGISSPGVASAFEANWPKWQNCDLGAPEPTPRWAFVEIPDGEERYNLAGHEKVIYHFEQLNVVERWKRRATCVRDLTTGKIENRLAQPPIWL